MSPFIEIRRFLNDSSKASEEWGPSRPLKVPTVSQ
jgi:hypothetical protein